jgi:2-polyprenyl-3-methyl-5-hydroxy-6-metoxy-1,4-benzoquinol methylase
MSHREMKDTRADREIEFGVELAKGDTESLWGWGSPAGRLRALRRAGLIAAGAGLAPGSRVLEVGCGTGLFTEMFVRSGACILAVDISPELLKKARQRDLPSPQVRFIEKRFEDCALESPFDAVIGSSVLHHLDLLPSCLKIFKLLRPGGSLAFAEPNMLNPQVYVERKFRKWFPRISADETAFIRTKLQRVLRESGFENIRIVPFDWLHPATPPRWMPLVQSLGRVLERIPIIREFSGSLLVSARRPGRE